MFLVQYGLWGALTYISVNGVKHLVKNVDSQRQMQPRNLGQLSLSTGWPWTYVKDKRSLLGKAVLTQESWDTKKYCHQLLLSIMQKQVQHSKILYCQEAKIQVKAQMWSHFPFNLISPSFSQRALALQLPTLSFLESRIIRFYVLLEVLVQLPHCANQTEQQTFPSGFDF